MIKSNIRNNAIKIKCRGHKIDTHLIPHMPNTITRAFIANATVYFSCDNPIAIKYNSGRPIMTFQSYGELTTRNKNKLREFIDYVTIPETDFNSELFDLLSKR